MCDKNFFFLCHKSQITFNSDRDRNLRYCDLCALDIIGDEYHTFFECTKPEIVSLRKRFIPLHYSQQPSMFKFVKLLRSVDDIKIGNRICSFIRHSKIV